MRKTSVYLPDRLKARLEAAAGASGRSEADLIRVAIEALLDAGGAADPRRPDGHRRRAERAAVVYGIGVGPGDAALLTVRAVETLRHADRVFAPCTSVDAVGRAEAIVRDAAPDVPIERLVFVMQADGAARDAAIEDAGRRVAECALAGEVVAFVTLGDPNVYSTFSSVAEVVARLAPTIPVRTIPGVMAFQDLAARAGTVLVDGDESLVLLPAAAGPEARVDAAIEQDRQAVVVYKGGRHVPEIAARLKEAGRLDDAVLGELLGLPGERVTSVGAVADRPASYLATIVVPPKRDEP